MRRAALALFAVAVAATVCWTRAIDPYEETETPSLYIRWNDDYGRPDDCSDFFTKLGCELEYVVDIDESWSAWKASSVEEANKWMKIIIDILVNAPEDDGDAGDEQEEYASIKSADDSENYEYSEGRYRRGEYEDKEDKEEYSREYEKYEEDEYKTEGGDYPIDDYARGVIAEAIAQIRGGLQYVTIAAAQPAAVPTECPNNACPTAGLYGLNLIEAPAVWNALPGIVNDAPTSSVMVIDTGVLATHADLAANLRNDLSTQLLNGAESPVRDTNGHGTHVAGTVFAAWNNGADSAVGVVGNAIGGVCGCERDTGGLDDICLNACINRAGERGVRVINLSWGRRGVTAALPPGDPERAAIERFCASGGLVVIAAGNDAKDISQTVPSTDFTYPAKLAQDLAETHPACIITVAAVDANTAMASFSNFGAAVKIAAPGVDIKSCGIASDTATAVKSGTSMAAPHVTGMAALLFNAFPGASRERVYSCIIDSAVRPVKANPANPGLVNGGIADLLGAYKCLLAAPHCPVRNLPPCVDAHSGVAVEHCDPARFCLALANNTERVCQYSYLPNGALCQPKRTHGAQVMFERVTAADSDVQAAVELMGYTRKHTAKHGSHKPATKPGNYTSDDKAHSEHDKAHSEHDTAAGYMHRKTPPHDGTQKPAHHTTNKPAYDSTKKKTQAEKRRHSKTKHSHTNKSKGHPIEHCGVCHAGKCVDEASQMCKRAKAY